MVSTNRLSVVCFGSRNTTVLVFVESKFDGLHAQRIVLTAVMKHGRVEVLSLALELEVECLEEDL
ncbi:hypothetical protein SOVF_172370 [Spinacia oleracea]|nr:hypothetical protein SOVF_172370 [Spinacia oleracea]